MISLDGRAPSPLWVRVQGPKPKDWQERLLAYSCSEGAREQLVALERAADPSSDRTRYLIGALEALRKLGLTLERWLDGLDALGEDEPDVLWRRALADEQSSRQRLAWELLVEVIGFRTTDTPEHWSHHAALLRLNRHASPLADVDTFFSCRPATLEAERRESAEHVIDCEEALGENLAGCWYAKRRTPVTVDKAERAGLGAFSSQRSRLQYALSHATPTERVALGVSYQRLYSRLSRRVHFSIADHDDQDEPDAASGHGDGEVSVDGLRWGTVVVGRLGGLCLARLQQLTGLDGGAVCRLHRDARDNQPDDPHQDMLAAIIAGSVRVGDFAMVGERLAEVRDRQVNELGYARYLVSYISERPRPEIGEEWRPATEVHTLWAREKIEGWLRDSLSQLDENQRQALLKLDPEERLLTYLRLIWELDLRGQVLGMMRQGPAVAYS